MTNYKDIEGYSTLCLMREHDVTIHAIATARVTGVVTVHNFIENTTETADKYIEKRGEHPQKGRMIMLPILEAEKKVEENIDKNFVKEWFEISSARHQEMLCCLPPEEMRRINGATIFRMCEYAVLNVTRHFAVYNERFFEGVFRVQPYSKLLPSLQKLERETQSIITKAVNDLVVEFTNPESKRYDWVREQKVRKEEITDRWPVPKTVWHINCGHCEDFAEELIDRVPGGVLMNLDAIFLDDSRFLPEDFLSRNTEERYDWIEKQGIPPHTVYFYNNRYYDAQNPEGVSDWTDLEVWLASRFDLGHEKWKKWKENMAKTQTGHVLMVWSSGLLEIGERKLPGSLALAYGEKSKLEDLVTKHGQLSREDNSTFLCPGFSLAKAEGRDTAVEVLKFQKRILEKLQKQ